MITTQTRSYEADGVACEAFIAHPADLSTPRPCVLIAHMWGGPNPFIHDKARLLAAQGYVAFALDVYGAGNRGATPEQSAALMRPFIEDRALLRRRLLGALDAARGLDGVDPARIGAIGYCFGGLCALELARSGADVRAVVSLHGMLHTSAPAAAGQVRASVLVLHGHEDPLAPPADLRALEAELTAAQVDWQVICYGHAAHAFTNPALNNRAGGMYHVPSADARSWRATLDHLHERLAT